MHDNSRNEHIQSDETIRIIRFRKKKRKKRKITFAIDLLSRLNVS